MRNIHLHFIICIYFNLLLLFFINLFWRGWVGDIIWMILSKDIYIEQNILGYSTMLICSSYFVVLFHGRSCEIKQCKPIIFSPRYSLQLITRFLKEMHHRTICKRLFLNKTFTYAGYLQHNISATFTPRFPPPPPASYL